MASHQPFQVAPTLSEYVHRHDMPTQVLHHTQVLFGQRGVWSKLNELDAIIKALTTRMAGMETKLDMTAKILEAAIAPQPTAHGPEVEPLQSWTGQGSSATTAVLPPNARIGSEQTVNDIVMHTDQGASGNEDEADAQSIAMMHVSGDRTIPANLAVNHTTSRKSIISWKIIARRVPDHDTAIAISATSAEHSQILVSTRSPYKATVNGQGWGLRHLELTLDTAISLRLSQG